MHLELVEALLATGGSDLDDVELDGLGQGAALADGDDVAALDVPEAGGDVGGEHLVPLLEPVVLLDVVQVIPPDGAGPVHLQSGDDAGQDPAPDADVAGEVLAANAAVAALIASVEGKLLEEDVCG